MNNPEILIYIISGIAVFIAVTMLAVWVTKNRDDDTSIAEPIIISIILTPVLAIILEMLKPYRPDYKRPQKSRLTIDDLTDEQKAALLKELDSKQ